MGEPSNTTKQPDMLGAVRTLLQTVQSPLTIWSALLDAATDVLADLDPPLDLVTFSPFAVLRAPEVTEPPAASQPLPRQQGAPADPTAAVATPTTKPVFALPPRTREPSALAPTVVRNSAAAARVLAQDHGGPSQTVASEPDAVKTAALLATMTQFAILTDTVRADQLVTAVEPAIPPDWPVANAGMPTSLAAVGSAAWPAMTVPATVATADGALAETMALLAGLTDTLLTSPNAGAAAHSAPPTPQKGAFPSASTAPSSSMSEPRHASGFGGPPSLPTAAKPAHAQASLSPPTLSATSGFAAAGVQGVMPFPEGTGPDVRLAGALAALPALPTEALSPEALPHGPLAPPDAWTLAQLINDVLAEEARRHGVDLS